MAHFLGTDPLGRDIASRLLWGARNSLFISISAVLIASSLGFVIGVVSGFFGGWVDAVLMRLSDIQLAFPFVLFAIAVLGVSLERTPPLLIAVLGLTTWMVYARVVRSRVLSEREKDYARAAKGLGASQARVVVRYIVPNVWQVLPVIAMLSLGFLIIVESLLSFLALGLTPPTPSWGSMLADGKQYMLVSPWLPLFPGLAILMTVLAVNLAADGLTDYFDPKMTYGHFRRVALPVRSPLKALAAAPLLRVRGLTTIFPLQHGTIRAVKDVSFDLERGQVLGIVGESGSGKSVLALSIVQLLDAPGIVTCGEILFAGRDLARISNRELAAIRGRKLAMIFQNPGTSLNPVLTVGFQMTETLGQNLKLIGDDAIRAAVKGLDSVGIGDPNRVLKAYPFQLSGGMQQRVMIALAMTSQPELLIADEPTTALDVTTQAQLLDHLDVLRQELGTSIIFITHDIALLADFADVIMVMYAGQVCEIGPRDQVIKTPRHPYTQALLNAISRADVLPTSRLNAIPGEPPDPSGVPAGCPFANRCPHAMAVCWGANPEMTVIDPTHQAACHLLGRHDNVATSN
jgi:peptide/nickel transport system permease protein